MNFFIILPQLTVHNIISPERFSITKKQQPRNGLYLRRSEEHTSELQSQSNLVCRLLLEKKKRRQNLRPGATVAVELRVSRGRLALARGERGLALEVHHPVPPRLDRPDPRVGSPERRAPA